MLITLHIMRTFKMCGKIKCIAVSNVDLVPPNRLLSGVGCGGVPLLRAVPQPSLHWLREGVAGQADPLLHLHPRPPLSAGRGRVRGRRRAGVRTRSQVLSPTVLTTNSIALGPARGAWPAAAVQRAAQASPASPAADSRSPSPVPPRRPAIRRNR